MIESLKIANVATYDRTGVEITNLKRINFFYGSNGCGKTTISNYIYDGADSKYASCIINWADNNPLLSLVYNKNFRERNFGSSEIAGVFTLGEATKEQVTEIKEKKSELENETVQRKTAITSMVSIREKLEEGKGEFTERCWELYKLNQSDFKSALKGSIGSKVKFSKRLISEYDNQNTIELVNRESLIEKSKVLSDKKPEEYQLLSNIPGLGMSNIESNQIWQKVIVGKNDVDIAKLITKLNSSDWVNQGRKFIPNDDTCPFCQQATIDSAFRAQLEDYFDDTYLKEVELVVSLKSEYERKAENLISMLQSLLIIEQENEVSFLDIDGFKANLVAVDGIIKSNLLKFQSKVEKSSTGVDVEEIGNKLKLLQEMIDLANGKIKEHNKLAKGYISEREKFISEVWRYLVEQKKVDIKKHLRMVDGKTKGLDSLQKQVDARNLKIGSLQREMAQLNRLNTSVQPAVDEINRLLTAYGFTSFNIVESKQLENHYCIQRQNGELVEDTLSEGEVTFITFLYFYQLAKGAQSEDAVSDDRILVIDDPISSLDSNVLYIVSALVKQLIDDSKKGEGNIKQIILLTHNVYFHKEASYQNGRSNGCNQTHYWILRKLNDVTNVNEYNQHNPIESSYELLWREIKESDRHSSVTIQNTMRRILENYFKILGGYKDKDIIKGFSSPEEQQVCRSLLYWINDGSHCLPDDLFIQNQDHNIELYLNVFRIVFKKAGHLAHYQMMMGEEDGSIDVALADDAA